MRYRAGAGRVDAPPPIETGLGARNRRPARGGMQSRRSGAGPSRCCCCRCCCCRRPWRGRLRDDCGHHGLDKHAVAHGAVEVALALDASIVFARLLLELDADPFAHLEVSWAREPHNSLAAIVEQDGLPRLEVRHYDDRSEGICCMVRFRGRREVGACLIRW